jgi:hypothetical protein
MIPGFSFSWLQAMIERSFPLPMRINIRISFDPVARDKSLAASALLSASRIRTLNISGRSIDVLTFLKRLCSPSPLESLSLHVFYARGHVDLPEALFNRNAPHLHSLTLESSACLRAPLWLLSGITHFTVRGGVSLHDLLNTLKAMPQLEMLHIARDTLAESDQAPPHVVLPRLSRLSIRERYLRRLVLISSHIDAPPTLRKHLHMTLNSPWEHDINIFPAVQALFPQDSGPGVEDGGLRVAQVTGGPTRGSFDVWSRAFSESASANGAAFAREDALFLFHIEWRRLRYHNDPRPFFRLARLCSHLCTARIEDLTAVPGIPTKNGTDVQDAQDAPDSVAQWQALLAALPAVKTLRLHRGSTTILSLLRALSASADLLPLLRKIFVVHVTVRYSAVSTDGCDGGGLSGADADFSMASPGPNLGVELVATLSGRSGLEVVLIGCEVDEEALEALREQARVEIREECVYTQAYK